MTPPRRPPGITVTGTASVAAPVDQVTLTLGVEVLRTDAGEAFAAAAATATQLLSVLADGGVQSRFVRTTQLSLGPRTNWQDNREVLLGYQANQQLIVQLSGLNGIERLLSDVVGRGGHGVRIDGVSLTAAAPEPALAEARELAFADAAGKARHYAALAGRSLGVVTRIEEAFGAVPLRDSAGSRKSMVVPLAAGADMPVATGDTQVTAAVTVFWEFAG